MKNVDVARQFVDHKSGGTANYQSFGDRLYSYEMLIALWDHATNIFYVSNRTSKLGGGMVSMTTSKHIHALIDELENVGAEYTLVDDVELKL